MIAAGIVLGALILIFWQAIIFGIILLAVAAVHLLTIDVLREGFTTTSFILVLVTVIIDTWIALYLWRSE
jgi:hypothetical protein